MQDHGNGSAFQFKSAVVDAFNPHRVTKAAEAPTMAFKAIGSTTEGVIIGIGAAAGNPDKLDLDEEFVSKADLVQMAYDFCSSKDRTFKANHREKIDCDLVASWPGAPIIKNGSGVRLLDDNEYLDDSMEVVGISTAKGAESHWFVGVKPKDPEIAELAAKGGIAGFSFGAHANRTAIEE